MICKHKTSDVARCLKEEKRQTSFFSPLSPLSISASSLSCRVLVLSSTLNEARGALNMRREKRRRGRERASKKGNFRAHRWPETTHFGARPLFFPSPSTLSPASSTRPISPAGHSRGNLLDKRISSTRPPREARSRRKQGARTGKEGRGSPFS